MKKILLSTALLTATAGMAAAEVTLSGTGRFGLDYKEDRGGVSDLNEVALSYRMRVNIDGKVETDAGVTFGGRVRLQYNNNGSSGSNGSTLSAAYLYATYEGFRLEVGNANGAVDSTALIFNSELGFQGFSAGNPIDSAEFVAFESSPFSNTPNRVGIFASYSVGDLNVRVSYHTLNQTDDDAKSYTGISADYVFGAITVSGGYQQIENDLVNGDVDSFAVGAEYAINDVANVGLLYFDAQVDGVGLIDADLDQNLVTLYGNYTFDAFTIRAFVSGGDNLGTEDTAYGLGVDYDLGGATLAAGVQQDFFGETQADAGVRFSF